MTPENLDACIADAAAAIIAGNRLIGRLNVESAIGSESETIDTWLMYAWTADDPAGAQLAIERAIQMDPENPLAVAGKTWIEGVKSLAESQVRERDQWEAEASALEEAANALADADDVCDQDDDCSAEQEVDDVSDVCVESEVEPAEAESVEVEVEVEADSESEDTVEIEAETDVEAEVAAEVEAEVDAEAGVEAEGHAEAEAAEVEAETEAAEVDAEAVEVVAEAELESEVVEVGAELESEAEVANAVEADIVAEDEEAEVAAEVEPETFAETEEVTAEVEVTSDDDVLEAVADSDESTEPVAIQDNSREAALAAARIASSIANVASQPVEAETIEPVSSLADDIRDSLKASIEDLGPSEDKSEEAVADSTEVTLDPAPAQDAETANVAPAHEVSSVEVTDVVEATDVVESTEKVEESVVQDLEEMAASVSEAVQPAPAAEPVQQVVDTPMVDQPVAQTPTAPAYDDSQPRSAVVMIVDDSPTIRKLVSMTLSRNGFEVIAAKDGVDALKLLTQQRPDIILTDINMPRLGGYKLCRFVKKQPKTKSIPVLMLSGKDGVFDKMKGKMAGASGHITKPFESADLVHQVRQQLLTAAGV